MDKMTGGLVFGLEEGVGEDLGDGRKWEVVWAAE